MGILSDNIANSTSNSVWMFSSEYGDEKGKFTVVKVVLSASPKLQFNTFLRIKKRLKNL